MDRITIVQDLSSAWLKAIKDGKIVNEFETLEGEKVEFGLTHRGGDLKYYARNIKTGCEIPALVEEKMVEQSGFVIQFNGYRALKPGGKIPNIGRQPDVPARAIDCRFQGGQPNKSVARKRIRCLPLCRYLKQW